MYIYCLRCQRKEACEGLKMVKDRRGRVRAAGKCKKCHTKVSQYVSKRSKSRSRSHKRRSHSKKRKLRSRSRYHKRSKSLTRKGRQDFVTHKGDIVYDVQGHYVRKSRKPYRKISRRSAYRKKSRKSRRRSHRSRRR